MSETWIKKHFYVFVRKDLSLPQQIVQSIHAAYEAALHITENDGEINSTVLCQAESEKQLLEISEYLDYRGIKHKTFVEPDIGHQHTSIATEPLTKKQRKYLSKFPLWKEE